MNNNEDWKKGQPGRTFKIEREPKEEEPAQTFEVETKKVVAQPGRTFTVEEKTPDPPEPKKIRVESDAAALLDEIDRQAAEARRDDLDDDEIIHNRFL